MFYSYAVGFKDIKFKSGKSIRLYSFDTAMLFGTKNISEDMMWMGKPQVDSLIKYGFMPAGDDIWYSIALFHHSDRFLHPNENYTYDGRDATLPLIMKNVDLLLCGHSESADKPRFTSQVGGAKMILSGATYYNDVHTNTFSTIYVSDIKKTCVFFPVIWKDDKWQDYEFMPETDDDKYDMHLKTIGYKTRNQLVLSRDDGHEYSIELEFSETDDLGRIHNFSDLFNPFHFHCDNNSLELSVNFNYDRFLDFMAEYAKCHNFCKGSNVRYVLYGNDGSIMASGSKIEFLSKFTLPDDQTLQSMFMIENSYGVRIYLPDEISEKEKKDIHFLVDMASKHHDYHPSHRKNRTIEMSKEEMMDLYDKINDGKKTILVHDVIPNVTVHLFSTDISVGEIDVYRGPYYIDVEDLKMKIDTYREKDRRVIAFNGDDSLWTYAIGSRYNDGTKFPDTENIIVENTSNT